MDNSVCCKKFDPTPWDGKLLEWNGKKFIKDSAFTIFYMPVNFGSLIKRLDRKIRDSGGSIPDGLCLSDHTSKWNMDIYLAVNKEIPGAYNTSLSGTFLSKVYEGPYKETGIWCNEFSQYAMNKNVKIRKWYMWYTTCPKCAKKYGKNYVVILAEVEAK